MDYRTKPTSRAELRTIATFIRKIFKCENEYYFDVIKAFDFSNTFPNGYNRDCSK